MFGIDAIEAVIRESYPEVEKDGDGLIFCADERAVCVRPVGSEHVILFAQVRELEGCLDEQETAELAFETLETTDELLEKGPFSLAVDRTRQFMHIQWLFDCALDGEAAFRAWLPQFVACAKIRDC